MTKNMNVIRLDDKLYNSLIKDICDDKIREYFGTWVTNIWTGPISLSSYFKLSNITFQDEKEIFFRTFQLLLEEGKIIVVEDNVESAIKNSLLSFDKKTLLQIPVFETPNIPIPSLERFPKDPRYKYWNSPAKYIVDHIRHIFPSDNRITDFNKLYTSMWFDLYCPAIGWVDQETGEVTAS